MAQDDVIQQIGAYIRTNITSPQAHVYKRPSNVDSITIIPYTQSPANVRMWSQETFVSIGVYIKASPQASYQKAMDIRDLLLAKKGTLATNGVKFLSFYTDAILPQVIDIAEDDNEIYGFTFKVKYIDNTVPV
jgi:hypothetical protein